MSVALVPVKHLSSGKSRLLPKLDRAALEALSLAMLEDILTALGATPSVDRSAVVTPDPTVAKRTKELGATALLRDDPGLNASIDLATAELGLSENEPLLIVLGDVAGAMGDELEALFEVLEQEPSGRAVVLAPSSDGGTSALLRAPADIIPSRFGPDSSKLHHDEAIRAGVPYSELSLPSLSIDLDLADDVERFLARGIGGECTRRVLAEFDWSGSRRDRS